jgi:hypothetical protein
MKTFLTWHFPELSESARVLKSTPILPHCTESTAHEPPLEAELFLFIDTLARLSSKVVVDAEEAVVAVEAESPQLGGGDGGGFWGPFCEEEAEFDEQRWRFSDEEELFLRLFRREPPPEPPNLTDKL